MISIANQELITKIDLKIKERNVMSKQIKYTKKL